MGSGARLRSANQAFGQSRTQAFLLTAEPAPQPPISCQMDGGVTDLFRQANPSNQATNDVDCGCGTWPGGQNFAKELRFTVAMKWLGWETPPFPPVIITGETSSAVITVPIHCAVQGCLPEGPIQWQRHGITLGVGGATFGVMSPLSNFLAYWDVGGSDPPFIDGEPATWDIEYTPEVLPDPGPYDIVSVSEDANFKPDLMSFTLDRALTYYTEAIVEIAGTNSPYDGRWEAEPVTSPSTVISVKVPNYGPLGAGGTLTRIFSPSWECFHNYLTPPGPKPTIPGGATPQVLTVGEFNFNFGYEAGAYGMLAPTAWEGQTIAEISAYSFTNVLTVRTETNAPLYGTSGINVSFGGIFGRFAFTPVVAGQGTYQRTDSALKNYLRDNVGNDLTIGISENV